MYRSLIAVVTVIAIVLQHMVRYWESLPQQILLHYENVTFLIEKIPLWKGHLNNQPQELHQMYRRGESRCVDRRK